MLPIPYLLFICFSFIQACTVSADSEKKEVYMQTTGQQPANRIELAGAGSTLRGYFYGTEILVEGGVLYYKAALGGLQLSDTTISFTLDSLVFSEKPIGEAPDAPVQKPGPDVRIPFLLQQGVKYFGNRQGDSLQLNKIYMLADSQFEKVVFVKKKG